MKPNDTLCKIGITGHRKMPEDKITTVTQSVRAFFMEMKKRYRGPDITALSPLAEGADMLCAKIALDLGIKLVVPLPMSASEYRKDFSGNVAAMFDCLLSMADEVLTAAPEESAPAHPPRGFYYRQAGIYTVNHCSILLAVWNGVERDTPDGAGTWETVKLARLRGKEIRQIW